MLFFNILQQQMPKELKNHTPLFQQLFSVVIFIVLVYNKTISHASLWVIFSLYCWIFLHLYHKTFKLKSLVNVLGLWGALYSVLVFVLFGVEEVPYPEGAVFFHITYIALSAGLLFISSVLLILGQSKETKTLFERFTNYFTQINVPETKESWEEATITDLESGDFETI